MLIGDGALFQELQYLVLSCPSSPTWLDNQVVRFSEVLTRKERGIFFELSCATLLFWESGNLLTCGEQSQMPSESALLTESDIALLNFRRLNGQGWNLRETKTYQRSLKQHLEDTFDFHQILHLSFLHGMNADKAVALMQDFIVKELSRKTKQHIFVMYWWDEQPNRANESSYHLHCLIRYERNPINLTGIELLWKSFTKGGDCLAATYDSERNMIGYLAGHHEDVSMFMACPRSGYRAARCNRKDRVCYWDRHPDLLHTFKQQA